MAALLSTREQVEEGIRNALAGPTFLVLCPRKASKGGSAFLKEQANAPPGGDGPKRLISRAGSPNDDYVAKLLTGHVAVGVWQPSEGYR